MKVSLDAIRKFKQQQELKKREEDAKKLEQKLTVLEHRAHQGDRKAKQQLKKIEKVQEEQQKIPKCSPVVDRSQSQRVCDNNVPKVKKVRDSEPTDFEELMKLAKTNTNEIRRDVNKPDVASTFHTRPDRKPELRAKKDVAELSRPKDGPARIPEMSRVGQYQENRKCPPSTTVGSKIVKHYDAKTRPTMSMVSRAAVNHPPNSRPMIRDHPVSRSSATIVPKNRPTMSYASQPRYAPDYYEDDYDDEDEDDYESDGFVVDEDNDEARTELNKTLKSIFGYDKRKCDRREEELERQYRAIGNVRTFEDLEREERRASRLAAAEDAMAAREEEERKLRKKKRMMK